MLRLIHGEIYRLLHKKSLYIYFGALALGYLALAFIRSGGFEPVSIIDDALSLFILMPALLGGFLFAAIYTDDLNSKNLISLVGSSTSKVTIVLAKFVLMALFSAVTFALAPLFHMGVYALLGQVATADMAAMLFAVSSKYLLAALAYAALSGIVVYGLQRTTFAIVTYLLLAFGVASGLISIALNMFAPTLTEHLITGITDRVLMALVSGASLGLPMIEYALYLVIAVAASLLVLSRKEMEF
ncbi:MAG: hypothetical protein FWE96_02975 [Coriobacteriia bacterium]|nr:hypothetical protein [Coriobacteriia bacterium]